MGVVKIDWGVAKSMRKRGLWIELEAYTLRGVLVMLFCVNLLVLIYSRNVEFFLQSFFLCKIVSSQIYAHELLLRMVFRIPRSELRYYQTFYSNFPKTLRFLVFLHHLFFCVSLH